MNPKMKKNAFHYNSILFLERQRGLFFILSFYLLYFVFLFG